MKKLSRTIFGLLASAMLVAGSVSFVSCSDDDEEETTQSVQVKTTTNTVTINGTAYTYTTVDGKVQTSDSVTVSDDGTITIKADDGSYVTIKGTAITYTNAEGKSSSGTLGTESVTLSGDAGEISATSTSETKTETKTTSGSEATASVTELAYNSDTLNNKVFSYDDDDEIRYLTFTDGKCYKSSSPDYIGSEKDYLFISYNNKIYRSQKATRISGSGLFATFDDGEECKYTLNSDGTGSMYFYEDGDSMSFTFTNNAGLITMSCTYEGETLTGAMYYNGEYLYDQKEELTFVKNYKTETQTTSGSEAAASVTELAYDSDTLNNKVFKRTYEDDGEEETKYHTFKDGKCYESSSSDYLGDEDDDDPVITEYNGKIYRSSKATRSSGSGLFVTFDDGEECKYTLKSDGTGSIYFYEDSSSLSFTFTNNAGLVTISCTYEGEPFSFVMYYNGENLYDLEDELTFVKNYSAN